MDPLHPSARVPTPPWGQSAPCLGWGVTAFAGIEAGGGGQIHRGCRGKQDVPQHLGWARAGLKPSSPGHPPPCACPSDPIGSWGTGLSPPRLS